MNFNFLNDLEEKTKFVQVENFYANSISNDQDHTLQNGDVKNNAYF